MNALQPNCAPLRDWDQHKYAEEVCERCHPVLHGGYDIALRRGFARHDIVLVLAVADVAAPEPVQQITGASVAPQNTAGALRMLADAVSYSVTAPAFVTQVAEALTVRPPDCVPVVLLMPGLNAIVHVTEGELRRAPSLEWLQVRRAPAGAPS